MEKRWCIVAEWKRNKQASIRSIAAKVGVHPNTAGLWIARYKQCGNVNDKPHPGRKRRLTQAMMAELKSIAAKQLRTTATSCLRLAQHLQKTFGVHVSAVTVMRALQRDGWKYGFAIKVPLLTPQHKQKRLDWAQWHIRHRTCFAKWMFTDSKIFLLQKIGTGRGMRFWAPYDSRTECSVSNSTLGVRVYLGLTQFGLTKPIFVTGAQSKLSAFVDPKTGKFHKGVCTREYVHDVLPTLKSEGDLKFGVAGRWGSEWIFQQDNAPCHVANSTKQALQHLLPNRYCGNWPPRSPDLSPIENVWAYLERKLQCSDASINTVVELQNAIKKAVKRVPKDMCHRLINKMPERLDLVVDRNGGHIGK